MNTDIRGYIDKLFQDAPKSRKALELKEEMVSNAEEKLADFIGQGYKEEDAVQVVINSIGNVEELFRELEESEAGAVDHTLLKLQQKKARFMAIAVGLYIFAGVVLFFFIMMSDSPDAYNMGIDAAMLGLMVAGLLCIAPTCMVVYVNTMIPKYHRKEDSMVEEYKEWKNASSRDKEIRKAVSNIIWMLAFIMYFIISFSTMSWYITWVIFLVAGCIESIVSLIFSMKNK